VILYVPVDGKFAQQLQRELEQNGELLIREDEQTVTHRGERQRKRQNRNKNRKQNQPLMTLQAKSNVYNIIC